MKRTISALALACAAVATAANAEEADMVPGEFSGNVALTSDYLFRGISQTDESPAIQGGFDWAHDSGVYLGVWASNVDFNDGDQATVEVDWYGGYAGSVGGLSYDLGAIYYAYPNASVARDYNFWEGALSLGYDLTNSLSIGVAYNYAPDFYAESGEAHYLSGSLDYTIPVALSPALSASLGHQWIDNNAAYGVPDYLTWSVGLSVDVEGFTLSATYSDTDIGKAQCIGGTDLCAARGVFAVSRSF